MNNAVANCGILFAYVIVSLGLLIGREWERDRDGH
jgi:hypothetical protein